LLLRWNFFAAGAAISRERSLPVREQSDPGRQIGQATPFAGKLPAPRAYGTAERPRKNISSIAPLRYTHAFGRADLLIFKTLAATSKLVPMVQSFTGEEFFRSL
jgi:hypothetical protein